MICADKEITIFHFENDDVIKEIFEKVSVFSEVKAVANGMENYSSGEITIRIPGYENIMVDIGDKVVLRKVEEDEIPYSEAYTIYNIKNNIRGSRQVSHICLKCR